MFQKFGTVKILRWQVPLVLLLAVAVLVPRLLFLGYAEFRHVPLQLVSPEDAGEYLTTGKNLFEHGVFSRDPQPPYTPDGFRTPGYPIFTYVVSLGLRSLTLISIAQYLLVVLASILVFLLGQKLFDRSSGVLAALLFALEPYFIFWSGLAMSETLFIVLLLLMLWSVMNALESGSWRHALLTGLWCGAATLTRPIMYPFFPVLTILLGYYLFLRSDARITGRAMMLSCIGFALLVAPWLIRNHHQFGRWSVSSVAAYNLYFYDVPLVLQREQGIPWKQSVGMLAEHIGYPGKRDYFFKDLHYESILLAGTWDYVKIMPTAFLKVRGYDVAAFLFNDGYEHIARAFHSSVSNWLRYSVMILWSGIYLLIGMTIRCRQTILGRQVITISLLIIGYFALATGAVASARYRVPVLPLLCILAAPSLVTLRRKLGN